MSRCLKCSSPFRRTRGDHRYVESGLSFVVLSQCILLVCIACDVSAAVLPNAETLHIAIVEKLLRVPARFTGEVIRFVRRSLKLTGDEFAGLLGTSRVEVSRWENEHSGMHGLTELRLRLQMIDLLLPPESATHATHHEVATVMTDLGFGNLPIPDLIIDAQAHYGADVNRRRMTRHRDDPVGAELES